MSAGDAKGDRGAMAVYAQSEGGARGGLLAKCSLSGTRASCPFEAPKRQSTDLLFVFEPSAAGAAIHLDSWSLTPSF